MEKAGSYIHIFITTELTIIPRLLHKYLGNYYNNTLCNGATWMFVIWCILHWLFDHCLNVLLKRMRYKEHLRARLRQSLWYLGFYTTACIYSSATLVRNDLVIFNPETPFDSTNTAPSHLILGFIIISTFFLHSAFWERLKYCHGVVAAKYFCLFLFFCFSYFLRFVESCFRLTVLISGTQIGLEVARFTAVIAKRDRTRGKVVSWAIFVLCVLLFTVVYVVLIPVSIGYPLVEGFTPNVTFLLTLLIIWLIIEVYSAVSTKAVIHLLNHTGKEDGEKEEKKDKCGLDLIECSLFCPRDDATYNFITMRKEMKRREEERNALLKKPKNRNVVFQTLKCMVAIKRKLNEKRKHASNDGENADVVVQEDHDGDNSDEGVEECVADSESEPDGDVVGGKLEFKISSRCENDCKCKKDL